MNREERTQQLLATINHYCEQHTDEPINSIAIQVATKMAEPQDRERVGAALLIALKHIDG